MSLSLNQLSDSKAHFFYHTHNTYSSEPAVLNLAGLLLGLQSTSKICIGEGFCNDSESSRDNLRLWCQKQISQAGISNCIPQNTVGCNYLSLPEIPASGPKVINHSCSRTQLEESLWWYWDYYPAALSLTHWGRDKMAAIFQMTFSNGFSWMKMYEFRFTFHWSLFLGVQLTISQHCFR